MTVNSSPLRILYLDHAPIWGGAEAVLLNLVSQLEPAQFMPIIGTPAQSSLAQAAAAQHIATTPIEIRPLNHAGIHFPIHLATAVTQIRRAIHQHQIQIIHSNTVRAHIAASATAALTRTPLIWTLHDNTFPPALVRRLSPIPHQVIAVSHWLAETYAPLGLAGKTAVITNGIALPKLVPAPANLRHELDIPAEAPIVINVGRLIAGKAPHLFVEAANIVGMEYPQAYFLLIGGPDSQPTPEAATYLAHVEQAVAQSPLGERLKAVGQRQDIGQFYETAVACVYNAIQPEGLPTVLLEAMSYALPVVASAIGGAMEIVEDGVTGCLVPPNDLASLVQAMSEILKHPPEAKAMGSKGQQRLKEEFSIVRQVNETSKIYKDLIKSE